ncbi:MFS general substrate transporter [Penicillium verhagenii]|uniref:MFS general substrate transporter n=1 Tax=Penicillium verhagenii TaxID=1562060 RepID=UPI002545BB47|nr:MFS general substrate transporter [Penicillium verhagenii]KAJ5917523.1 MFS general substrate transporter [Penicillium verhagenii]
MATQHKGSATGPHSTSSLFSHSPPKKEDHPSNLSLGAPYRSARSWCPKRKILISAGAIASFLVITLTTSIYIASIPGIMVEFHVGQTLALSPVTFYAMGFTIGPMCTAALSEEFGRQYIYKVSLLLHLVLTVIAGAARNFYTIALCRALAGLVGSPAVSVFAGVLNDLWEMPEDRLAVPLFVLYGLGGAIAPEIGPVVGEAIVASSGWRWTFWLTAILVGACFLAMLFVPETFEPEIKRKALNLPREGWLEALTASFKRPMHMLLVEPIIFPTAAIVTVSQVVIFILYAGYPVVLERVYGFTSYQVGLAFLPLLVGSLLAAPVLSWVDRHKRALASPAPEDNLPGAMLAAILLPISLFWLAWTTRPTIHWAWPLLAGIPYGLGFALSQLVYPLYKNEVYCQVGLGASSLAVDVFMRYAISCVFPLFTIPLIDEIGFDWVMTGCGLVMVALAPVPWLLRKYGPLLRSRSFYLNRINPKKDLSEMTQA